MDVKINVDINISINSDKLKNIEAMLRTLLAQRSAPLPPKREIKKSSTSAAPVVEAPAVVPPPIVKKEEVNADGKDEELSVEDRMLDVIGDIEQTVETNGKQPVNVTVNKIVENIAQVITPEGMSPQGTEIMGNIMTLFTNMLNKGQATKKADVEEEPTVWPE